MPEFSILLPAEDKRQYEFVHLLIVIRLNSSFAALFKELEDRRIELHIKNFGLSFNTLEQVFLKVGDSVASEKDKDAGQTAHDEIDSSASDKNISNIAKHLFMRQGLRFKNQLICNKIISTLHLWLDQ